jgi:methionyl-tRNA formyltransferase
LFVVVAYGQILPKTVISLPKIFSLNIHASLLPKYRGAAPINWAIIDGQTETGISSMKMNEKMDAGPIILQKKVPISAEDTAKTLGKKIENLAAQTLNQSLELIKLNKYTLIEQDESMVSFAPKLKKTDGCIDWAKPVTRIHNLIRGMADWPGAFTYYRGRLLKIFRSSIIPLPDPEQKAVPGQIIEISKNGISVACADGNLLIEELQLEGGRRMASAEFTAGHKVICQEKFGKKCIA